MKGFFKRLLGIDELEGKVVELNEKIGKLEGQLEEMKSKSQTATNSAQQNVVSIIDEWLNGDKAE